MNWFTLPPCRIKESKRLADRAANALPTEPSFWPRSSLSSQGERAGETAQQLIAGVALLEGRGLITSTHTPVCTPL